MFGWIWDWNQQGEINQNREELGRTAAAQRELQDRVQELESKVDAMALYTAAMWELLSAKVPLAKEELRAKVEEIDLRDGVRDGRITPKQRTCSACHRPIAGRHRRCIYCGAEATTNP